MNKDSGAMSEFKNFLVALPAILTIIAGIVLVTSFGGSSGGCAYEDDMCKADYYEAQANP